MGRAGQACASRVVCLVTRHNEGREIMDVGKPWNTSAHDHASAWHLQFCDNENNRDITTEFYAADDATEIRLWELDTCVVAVQKNARSCKWRVVASDQYSIRGISARKAFDDWRDAMRSLNPFIADALTAAEK